MIIKDSSGRCFHTIICPRCQKRTLGISKDGPCISCRRRINHRNRLKQALDAACSLERSDKPEPVMPVYTEPDNVDRSIILEDG